MDRFGSQSADTQWRVSQSDTRAGGRDYDFIVKALAVVITPI
jgi:hypothetical protein